MLDADTLIKKKSVKLEDIAAMGQDVILCEETLGPKFKINMGAMILNKTDNTFKFLKDLHDSRVYWAKYHFISQEFVNDNLESMPITVVPETTFNTILYPDFSKYSPNDFIVHFAANENRIQVIKDFVKQYGY
jgi:hypothetical protein